MARKKEVEAEKENGERWLLTYADLITLLMIFFIVMYSMSKIDANKFRALADSLNTALGGGTPAKVEISNNPSGPAIFVTGNPQANATQSGQSSNPDKTAAAQNNSQQSQGNIDVENMTIEQIKARLDAFAKDNNIQSSLVSSIEERGLVVSIQDTLLFDSGSAVITPRAHQILDKISTVLATAPNYIRVEGHTDNLPIHTLQFPSNWELSVIRATNVVQIMAVEGGIASARLSATGYGEYRPITTNTTEAGRSQNRRVDLIILRAKYDTTEPGAPAGDQKLPSAMINSPLSASTSPSVQH